MRYLVCVWVPRFLGLRATRQQNSDSNGFIATVAIFLAILRSKVMAQATVRSTSLHYLDWVRLHCVLWRHKKPQRRASHMLSTTVAGLCQTLREIYTSVETTSKHILFGPSISGTAHAQCAEGLHFSAKLGVVPQGSCPLTFSITQPKGRAPSHNTTTNGVLSIGLIMSTRE